MTNITTFHLKQWGSESNCNYILFVGISHLVVSAILAFSFGYLMWKEHDRCNIQYIEFKFLLFVHFLMFLGLHLVHF